MGMQEQGDCDSVQFMQEKVDKIRHIQEERAIRQKAFMEKLDASA